MAKWIKNKTKTQYPTISSQKKLISFKDTNRLKEWEKTFQANGNQKKKKEKAGKTLLRQKNFKDDKKRQSHHMIINWPIHQEDITILRNYVPTLVAPKCIKQKLTELRGEINRNTILIRDFNTPLSTIYRSSRQRIIKETVNLNNTINQMDLTDIYKTFYPTKADYIIFLSTQTICQATKQVLPNSRRLKSY